jgi:hypothetical protein
MEINKAPLSSQFMASLLRQRDVSVVSKKVDAVTEIQGPAAEKQGAPRRALSQEDLRYALEALDERQASLGERAQPEGYTLHNRVRMALSAYTAQQNQMRDDNSRSLREMLGVDFYA